MHNVQRVADPLFLKAALKSKFKMLMSENFTFREILKNSAFFFEWWNKISLM